MLRALHRRVSLALLAACGALTVPLAAQQQAEPPTPLGQEVTEALCARYTAADHWVQKVVILLSLNAWWHPAGVGMILAALRDKDDRLNAFGLEALLRADPELLPKVASVDLLDELITRQLGRNNAHLKERALLALHRLAPTVEATDRSGWTNWWSTAKTTFAPDAWAARAQPTTGEGGTSAAAQRAFDLYQAGLDMMIVIDSTGSMQPTIDALGEALAEMVDILDGISPKMRLGIVHYKDYGELGKQGAKVLQPFTKNIRSARKELEKLRAFGGEDLPEAVLGGLELALDEKMNWKQDANKLVVLIGDAPPHANETAKVLALVQAAHDTPGVPVDKPTTGAKSDATPFLTSCIGVFVELQGKLREQRGYREFVDSQKQMREDFAAIAKAGGGVFVEVQFTFTDQPDPADKDKGRGKGKDRGKGEAIASAATRRIVEHILVLSFGERFAREMRDFVRIFYEYKEAGLIK
ncbi:MAG: VWA domain-containing protein [Planctomycetes bacterium]|nr:VWA domain-containing protein [Planctomycetota bacterium]